MLRVFTYNLHYALPNTLRKSDQSRSALQSFSDTKHGMRKGANFNAALPLSKSILKNLIHIERIFKQSIINN